MKGDGMSKYLKFVTPLALSCLFVTACSSGDDDGGGTPSADAMVQSQADAMVQNQADAMVGDTSITMGLGKTCNAPADCGPPAQGCLAPPNQPGICSGICKEGYVVTTNANGAVALPDANDPSHQTCADMFSGTVGIPACAVITMADPADNPLKPNTQYTLQLACAVLADNGVCPDNLTVDSQGACNP